MKEDKNVLSEKELELGRKINVEKELDDVAPDNGGIPGQIHDLRGVWTKAQIAANPLSYIAHLKRKLEGEYHSSKISEIISEIEKIENQYKLREEERTISRNK